MKRFVALLCLSTLVVLAQERIDEQRIDPILIAPDPHKPPAPASPPVQPALIDRTADQSTYALGPGDKLVVDALDVEEFAGQILIIDRAGTINLPFVGRVPAAGLTVEQLEDDIAGRLKTYLHEPQVTVMIVEFQSRPISVFGSVQQPGVIQLQGPKTLYEVISLAGGLSADVGDLIRITRRAENGEIPLPGVRLDKTGQFYSAELPVRDLLDMSTPEQNIVVLPHDAITVDRADVVYVVGNVQRGGGFVSKGSISVLEALSLAGGLSQFAASKNARILRTQPNTDERQLIAIDLESLLKGKAEDVVLRPDDILYVPNSALKQWTARTTSAAIAVASGMAIFSVR